ncbi:MAG TPA: YhjD/YihY/BrkB family envelope integrity protein [Thermoanaerobaculia bacterium]|nr:YhjD/YihY/BrkB family envelope integrity protein [Thermoanaerobaculia bacterium]
MSAPAPRPRARDGRTGRPSFARQLARFFQLTLRQGHEDSILLTASALAFVTILSLVPLLAALSFVGARVWSEYPQRSLEVFVQVLPYSEKTVTDKLREYLDQAETIHGFGLAALFATALLAFATVEETINKIWNVSRRRPFRHRLLSFILLLFWGPVLIGVTFSSLILLRQSPALRQLVRGSFLLNVVPFLATAVGLTLLYWLVPSTKVRLRNALTGGLFAAILLEIVRQSFGYYVEFFRGVSTVYGSSAFALLFMISIELTWAIVLLGSEAAYTAQHFALLSRGLHSHPPVQASWVGLAAVSLIAARGARGEPTLASESLAERLSLPARDLERTLHPLISHGLLRATKERAYMLTCEPRDLPVERVFEAYEHRARRGVEHVPGELRDRLERWIGALAAVRARRLGGLTLGDLIAAEGAPAGELPAVTAAVALSRAD